MYGHNDIRSKSAAVPAVTLMYAICCCSKAKPQYTLAKPRLNFETSGTPSSVQTSTCGLYLLSLENRSGFQLSVVVLVAARPLLALFIDVYLYSAYALARVEIKENPADSDERKYHMYLSTFRSVHLGKN